MARQRNIAFEMQSLGAGFEVENVLGSPVVETVIKRSGSASMEVSGSITAGQYEGAYQRVKSDQTTIPTGYYRWAIYIDSMDSDSGATNLTLDLYNSALSVNAASIQIANNAGTLGMTIYYNDFASTLSNTASLSFDTWHVIEMYYNNADAAGSDDLTVWVDGTQVANSNALTLSTAPYYLQFGVYNGSGVTISGTTVYFDDISVNDTSGSQCNGRVGLGKLVLALPTGAGDNAATTGIYSYINEIPPSNTATSGSTMIELDSNGVIGEYAMTNSSTLGIGSSDTIVMLEVLARIREEAAGVSSYNLRLKSASGGTTTVTSNTDANNATPRTNPGAVAFQKQLVSHLDPTTGVAWTPTGTNSVDNMQAGVGSADADSTPDLWCLWLGTYIEYVPVSAVTISPNDIALSLSEDNTTLAQNHVVASQDVALGLTEDNSSLTQNHIVASNDIALGLAEDNATIAQAHIIQPQDITLSLTEDSTIVDYEPITPTGQLIGDGFESGIGGWSSAGSTVAQSSEQASAGTYSAKFTASTSSPTLQRTPYASDVNTYVKMSFRYYFVAVPTAAVVISRLRNTAFGQVTGLKLDTSRNLVGKNADGTDGSTIVTSSVMTTGTWHTIEHWYDPVSGLNAARVDNSDVVTWLNNTPTVWAKYQIGMVQSTTLTSYYDEVKVEIGNPALLFNGVDGMIDLGDNANFSIPTTGAISIAAWIRPDILTFPDEEGSGYVHWLSKVDTGANEWLFRMYGADNSEGRENRISFYVYAEDGLPAGDGVAFQEPVTAGEWIHVIGTIDSSGNMAIYKNGVKKDTFTTSLTLTDTATPVRIGSGAQNANPDNRSYFKGAVDDIILWDRELSEAEAFQVFAGSPSASGMTARYRTSEGYLDTIYDELSANSADTGTAQWILGDDHLIILPNDIALSLSEDSLTINQNHLVASSDLALGLSEDNATINQNHILASQDIALSLTEDATTIAQVHIIASADILLSLAEDNTTITQTNFVLTAQDIALGLTEDNATITQLHLIVTADIALALTEDSATISQNHIVSVADILLSLTEDTTTVVEDIINIIAQDMALALGEDNTTLVQLHVLVSDDIALALTIDNATFILGLDVFPDDITLALALDNTSLIENYILVVQDIALALTVDAALAALGSRPLIGIINTGRVSGSVTSGASSGAVDSDSRPQEVDTSAKTGAVNTGSSSGTI